MHKGWYHQTMEKDSILEKTISLIARTWKQPRCPSAGEWMHKGWYHQTMENDSILEKTISRYPTTKKNHGGMLTAYD